ncbi:hypothetical protein DY000_02011587 [Brassica cretica]|uniref:DUF4236 domain-containing protein n=1 Tax=Brassica cretica TaxID=69181 RepID=A0ABQ7CL80_BRACR|nr:hypothetical protein DY000_02011587 [Brassica cretica]
MSPIASGVRAGRGTRVTLPRVKLSMSYAGKGTRVHSTRVRSPSPTKFVRAGKGTRVNPSRVEPTTKRRG